MISQNRVITAHFLIPGNIESLERTNNGINKIVDEKIKSMKLARLMCYAELALYPLTFISATISAPMAYVICGIGFIGGIPYTWAWYKIHSIVEKMKFIGKKILFLE